MMLNCRLTANLPFEILKTKNFSMNFFLWYLIITKKLNQKDNL